ncbi:peptidoglycan-binding domain-containing protein [Streptacidiphilus cavernicola]|uniref:Peptidoglycan-binding protein n=1 Tax=Streptacidiphilus cavernicola TaxID=3342716 RepID=A0ABV6VQW3_9ACTN
MESQPDLVRPYVAHLGRTAPDPAATPSVWEEDTADLPASAGEQRNRGTSRRQLGFALALLLAAAAALSVPALLGRQGAPAPGHRPGSSRAAAAGSAAAAPVPASPQPSANGRAGPTGSPSPGMPLPRPSGGPYSTSASISFAPVPGSADATLRPGDRGPAVTRLQHLLFDQGFTYVSATGVYDDATTRGVTQLQHDRGLAADPTGVYGPQSRASLDPDPTATTG